MQKMGIPQKRLLTKNKRSSPSSAWRIDRIPLEYNAVALRAPAFFFFEKTGPPGTREPARIGEWPYWPCLPEGRLKALLIDLIDHLIIIIINIDIRKMYF